jgi:hypothetical protein
VGWAFTSWASSGAPPFHPGLFSFIAGGALIVIVPFSTILGAIAAVLQHWLLTKLPSSRPPASAP